MIFGRLTVLEVKRIDGIKYSLCKCECGDKKWIRNSALTRTSKPTRSCGCLSIEAARIPKYKHGLAATREHSIWRGIKDRCTNPNNKSFPKYGARGITVCDRWLKFENFYADMGLAPSNTHSVDRIDTSKGYSPDNCRWATALTQARNARSNIKITYQNDTKCLSEWAAIFDITYSTLYSRYKKYGSEAVDKLFK